MRVEATPTIRRREKSNAFFSRTASAAALFTTLAPTKVWAGDDGATTKHIRQHESARIRHARHVHYVSDPRHEAPKTHADRVITWSTLVDPIFEPDDFSPQVAAWSPLHALPFAASRIRAKWLRALLSVAGAFKACVMFTISRCVGESSLKNVLGAHDTALPYFVRFTQ